MIVDKVVLIHDLFEERIEATINGMEWLWAVTMAICYIYGCT